MKSKAPQIFTLILSSLAFAGWLQAAPTAADVGDAESFGHSALYMGAASGFVRLAPACSPAPAAATANNDQCFQLNPQPASTSFEANDICRINLPKKATRTVIYPVLNFFLRYELKNETGVFQPQGLLTYRATISIESDALLDPSIIDPSTGTSANGKLAAVFSDKYEDDRSMDSTDRQKHSMTFVRLGNTGITKASLVAQGLSQAAVDHLFNSSMTIRMNIIDGSARLLTSTKTATITGNMRLFGD